MSANPSVHTFSSDDEHFLDDLTRRITTHPDWAQIAILSTLRRAMDVVRLGFSTHEQALTFFERPRATLHLQFQWHAHLGHIKDAWPRGERAKVVSRRYKSPDHIMDTTFRYADWFARTQVLLLLTQDCMYLVSSGERTRAVSSDISERVRSLPSVVRNDVIDDAFRPVYLGPMMESSSAADDDLNGWREAARKHRYWHAEVVLGGRTFPVSLLAAVEPMTSDRDNEEAYFPVHLAAGLPDEQLREHGHWHAEALMDLWDQLQRQVDQRLDALGQRRRPVLERQDVIPVTPPTPPDTAKEADGRIINVLDDLCRDVAHIKEGIGTLTTRIDGIESAKSRVSLVAETRVVIVDGEPIGLNETQFALVKVLCEDAPKLFSPDDFEKRGVIGNRSRIVRNLPEKVRALIVCTQGQGMKMVIHERRT